MARKKPEYLETNLPLLLDLCEDKGYEYERLNKYHYRILGATHIIDIWPSRMVYHRLSGEVINAFEDYHRKLDTKFNYSQVNQLLATGSFGDTDGSR